ncbi:MAG TPA: undecaprenyl-diphosphate phosphatase [Thermomicrobiales bacterium]
MSIFEAIVLGLVQGLTEFLPISSSGHLILVPWLVGWDEPGLAFDAALHLGTLLAVFAYFWRELLGMLLAVPTALSRPRELLQMEPPAAVEGLRPVSGGSTSGREWDARLALLLIVGSIPGGVLGLIFQGKIDDFFHAESHRPFSIVVIALLLMGFALLLWWADRVAVHRRGIESLTVRDTVVIGSAQALALMPGVSRSGSTLTAGLFRGLRREDAARFSFLLGVPLTTAAALTGVKDILDASPSGHEVTTMIVGIAVSAVTGFAAIWTLLRLLQRHSAAIFVVYRVAVGLLVLGLIAAGVR